MLPRLCLDKLAQSAEAAIKTYQPVGAGALETRSASMPLIPPRTTPTVNTVMKSSEDPSWFVVISPRETRGLAGPLSVAQLKQMYKVGEVTDRTLVWQEGESNWQQLVHHSFLRSQLMYLPILPPRVGTYNAELAIFDPIIDVPVKAAESLVPLTEVTASKACKQCGNIAVVHSASLGEQIPDLFRCRAEVGTNEYASEVLPGFLWIGSAQAVKHRSIVTLGFTLIINCTKNMKSPQPQPPHFRCKFIPLVETPASDFTDREADEIIGQLEKCYDWVELERTVPEIVAKSDLKPKPFRGPTDQLGQPIKGAADKAAFRHKLDEGDKTPPSRVLIWSKLGTDRSGFVAAAFLIKNYGISIDKAVTIIKANRPETTISSPYMKVLEKWEQKYIMGLLLCQDCAEEKTRRLAEEQVSAAEENKEPDLYDQCTNLLQKHLPKLIGNHTDISRLGNPKEYIVKIGQNMFTNSPWSGLLDLELSDRRLTDRNLAFLFQLLTGCEVMSQLRIINLRNNCFSVLASREFLLAFFAKNTDPDDDFYLEDALSYPDKAHSLTLLDLSYNTQMDDISVRYLSFFLKQCNSLVTLNLFSDHLADYLLAMIVSCFIKPTSVFQTFRDVGYSHDEDDNGSVFSGQAELMCNESITDLNIGRNSVGSEAAAALTSMFKQNAVITVLRMELCTGIVPKDWKSICNAIRLYNSSLTAMILHSNALTVKTCEYISNIHSSLDTRLCKLLLPMCGLHHLHIAALSKHLTSAHHLKVLDLSGNDIGDAGVESLCQLIKGTVTVDDLHVPPLEHLDFNTCGLSPVGINKLMAAMVTRKCFQLVDLSNNIIGPKNEDFLTRFGQLSAVDLRMNYCQIKSNMASVMFRMLAHRSRSHIGNPSSAQASLVRGNLLESLRFFSLAGNEISDSSAEALCAMLDKNISLEVLDLGYNSFTQNSAQFFTYATQINSESAEEKKVYPLHVNLIGNKCDPYMLEAPGQSRSKMNYHFGTQANVEDASAFGYSHVESRTRGKFLVQMQMEEMYRKGFPSKPLNHVA